MIARRAVELGISPGALALDPIRCRIRVGSLAVSSHHFMAEDELHTATGQERLQACVFGLPIAGRMVPMCEVNTTGYRDAVHAGAASS